MTERKVRSFCLTIQTFLRESTLQGLRFIGDDSLSLWERGFFLCTFVAALISPIYICLSIFQLMIARPILIGTDPYPTLISHVPFPAITLCNTNKLLLSKVTKYREKSNESAAMDVACSKPAERHGNELPTNYKNNNISITDFIVQHTQSCSAMLLKCNFNAKEYNCSDLFEEHITDAGKCCVFNLMHIKFRAKPNARLNYNYPNISGTVPVDWSPENGYQKDLPLEFSPRAGYGTGILMGLTVILDAQLDEYYCSSTNGPGFKFDIHSPLDEPRVKDNGLSIASGVETLLRLTPHGSSANSRTRKLHQSVRRCIFNNENHLVYYNYYTRKNCVNECKSNFIYKACGCIPNELPLIFANATVCGISQTYCVFDARKFWFDDSNSICRTKCLRPCFTLTCTLRANTAKLVNDKATFMHKKILSKFNRDYIRRNIAVVHIFFRKKTFYGDVRNVYIGFYEFISDSGAILGLFLGLSFISLTEIFYFPLMRIFRWWKSIRNQTKANVRESETSRNIIRKSQTPLNDINGQT